MRDQRFGHQAAHWHTLIFEDERRIDMRYAGPKDVQKMLLQQVRTALEEVGNQARKRRFEGWDLVGAACGLVAQENEGRLDGKTSKCRQKTGYGRRLGAEETFRHWLVGWKKPVTGRKAQKSVGPTIVQNGRRSDRRLPEIRSKT